MNVIKRPLAATSVAVLLGLALTSCGDSYPTDASKSDFCKEIGDTVKVTSKVTGDEPNESQWKDVQKAYGDLGDVGTPKGIGDSERKGFEVIVDTITGLDYDEAKKEFGDKGGDDLPGVSKSDSKKADKFFEYAGKECAGQLGG